MIERIISGNEAAQRLDKYLAKVMPNASKGFYYKMLRKKNITLNNKKAEGKEKLAAGDVVRFFLSDETFVKFSETQSGFGQIKGLKIPSDLEVIYEDDNIIIFNKPSGMLSQKAAIEDISLNEYLISYLIQTNQITEDTLKTFKPSICNRLDRNTSGLVLCGKSLKGLQKMSEIIKDKSIKKYYYAVVSGNLDREMKLEGRLRKDVLTNKVDVVNERNTKVEGKSYKDNDNSDSKYILTNVYPVKSVTLGFGSATLVEVELITGKTHQIRAHLSSIGHPILGDYKYGTKSINNMIKSEFGIKDQMLHAYRIVMPVLNDPFGELSNREFKVGLPKEFERVLQNQG